MDSDDPFDVPPNHVTDDLPDTSTLFGYYRHHKVVVFVDMLGFSALTEQHSIDPEVFEEMQRPGAIEFLRASLEAMEADSLAERFIRFHLLIETAVQGVRLSADGASITFSDCAFFAADTFPTAIRYATSVMHLALEQRVPLRIGVGCGDFYVVRIRADFGTTNQDHVVQFLGSGVSRAHAAERCGIKGLRILLHPSIDLLTNKWIRDDHKLGRWYAPIDVPAEEQRNRANVTKEINYIWHPRHDDTYWKAVEVMRAATPTDERHHYDATADALNRMRHALGRPSFNGHPRGE